MINLPNGLFIIKYNININDLINICIESKRKVDIITDLIIELPQNDWIHLINNINKKYDYIFIIDDICNAFENYNKIINYIKDNHWIGYMLPIINNYIQYNDVNIIKDKIIKIGFDALVIANVKNIIGKENLILFNNLQDINKYSVLTQLNNNKLIWSNIFRSCGFYNGKIQWEAKELSSN